MDENNQENEKAIRLPKTITVKVFSERLKLPVSQVITELMKNNILASINEEIDFETASIISEDLGYKPLEEAEEGDGVMTLEKLIELCKKEKGSGVRLKERPPVVTILGHVDHGKTSLLDAIRKTSVASGEAGGITQHIKAYQVKKRGNIITFVDTPGHEAFSAMRERGVSIADIAVLVVAADDGVRPQTKEVITFLKEKKIPTVVAINKIDKPEANIQKVKQELANLDVVLEEWGGNVMANEISAKGNVGIDSLLDSIILLAEVEDFRSDYKRDGLAVVLESHLDDKKGPVATVLVKTGTLKVGQDVIAGSSFGRIRRIEDHTGKNITLAEPSMPVVLTGINSAPNVNDILQVIQETSSRLKAKKMTEAQESAEKRTVKQRVMEAIDDTKIKKLNIILKVDVQGTIEAVEQILSTIKSEEVAVNVLESGVGSITESDVKIAESSGATIFGFNVEATSVAKRIADSENIKIKTFGVIYELIEEIKSMLSDLLPPEIERMDLGTVKVLAIFKKGKKDMIVGGRVTNGKMKKGSLIEIKRDKEIIGNGKLINLQQNKENIEEVKKGNECGMTFEGDVKIQEGDVLAGYTEEEKKRKI